MNTVKIGIKAGIIFLFLSCFPAFSQSHDFHIRAFDKCVKSDKIVSTQLRLSDTSYFDLNYGLYYVYTFKHNSYNFGQYDNSGISGDAVMDLVITERRPVFSLKKHIIEESSHHYQERDTLLQIAQMLPIEFHKKEKLRYDLELDFFYLKDKKGNWNCMIPNGHTLWLYTFKKTRKSSLHRLHKEFLGIIAENCENH